MRYLIVIEKAATGFSAYSPDLPGCVSTGSTHDEIKKNIREAIEFHLAGSGKKAMNCRCPALTQSTLTFLPNICIPAPADRDCVLDIGQTDTGRYLRVIYARDPKPDSIFVITAYELEGKPLKAYRRRIDSLSVTSLRFAKKFRGSMILSAES